jgi:two-component system response regulator
MDDLPILIAEDSEDDVYLLRRAYANPLRFVSDGEQVLAYLRGEGPYADRRQFPFPGLLLLDIKMPGLNGLETLSAIRGDAHFKPLVVILFSSSDREQDINEAFDLRANSYLVKPANIEGLVDALRKIKDYWLSHNQYPRC